MSILHHPQVHAFADVRAGGWTVDVPSGRFEVREWTWGERRRLLDTCTRGGQLDRDAFVDGLCELVVVPAPAVADVPVLAAAALRLLGAVPERPAPSLVEGEGWFARVWGWGPAELDHQPADRLDRHLAELDVGPAAGAAPDRGWTSIEVDDER